MKRPSTSVLLCLTLLVGCRRAPVIEPDKLQLTPDVKLIEDTIHSHVLGRDVQVRFIVPIAELQHPLSVVYLLHGSGVTYRDWTNNSKIAAFAAKGEVLVLPNMPGAFYINQANGPAYRYEDFFFQELVPEVHRVVPVAASDRTHTAIVGVSRGGYGAAVLGLRHADKFGFVGLLSPAADFARRDFRWRSPWQTLELRKIFGPPGSVTRRENNPFVFVKAMPADRFPRFFLASGDRDPLLPITQELAEALSKHGAHEDMHLLHGGHNWRAWNEALPMLEKSLLQQFSGMEATEGTAQ